MSLLFSLAAYILVLGFMLAGLVYMVSPAQGAALLKRLLLLTFGLMFGICILAQLMRSLPDSLFLLLLLFMLSTAAYFIREARLGPKRKEVGRRFGTERTPVLPNGFDRENE